MHASSSTFGAQRPEYGRIDGVKATPGALPTSLIGDHDPVPCVDGTARPYLNLDSAASTSALPAVAQRVAEFLPTYSSVHRGAGYRSRQSTAAYERARESALAFAGRAESGGDVAIFCRNTTEAINHLAYRLLIEPRDVVVTTVIEHHANLLPWARLCDRRFVECGLDGTFTAEAVTAALDVRPHPRLLAISGASNVTGWTPPLEAIIGAAHDRGVPVLVDAAQLAPHAPLPVTADYLAWSGHKMYAPFGAGVLVGPRSTFAEGDPFLAGGGAVDLVDLDEVVWTDPPDREEAGSPNVIGAVALDAAIGELLGIGWPAIQAHDEAVRAALRAGLAEIPGVRLLGPPADDRHVAVGDVRRGGDPSRTGGRTAQRRVRDRCPSRVLLCPPLPAPLARLVGCGGPRLPTGGVGGRSPRDSRRRAGQRRSVDLVG